MNYRNAIIYLIPDATFGMLNQEKYETLEWAKENEKAQPTKEECDAVADEASAAAQAVKDSQLALKRLQEIDAASIRGLREFLMKKFKDDPDLPAQLAQHEAEAITEREKLT